MRDTRTVTTKVDAAGNRVSEVYPSSLALTYAYNDVNALASVTDGTNTIASFTYVGFRPKVTTLGNGATATYTWGGFRPQLTGIHHQDSGSGTLVRMDYGYNQVHDRTYERFGASGSAGDAFEYDQARRLTKAWMGSSTPESPTGNPYVKTIAYNMDDDGNRTSVVTTPYGQSPATESYASNNLNQYTTVGGVSQSHDANGNLTNNGTYTFKYNYKNLIAEVRTSGGGTLVATYQYDANGRRVKKVVSGGIAERYIYSGVETVSVYDGSEAWKQDFVFDPTGIDRILMLEQADVLDEDADADTSELTRSYYHTNALGSVMMISTAGQAEAASYRYTPYGERTITVGGTPQGSDPLGQGWGYTGRLHDVESGLTYYRARVKASTNGGFVQRDPLGISADSNAYRYCRNAPGTYVDPLGLSDREVIEMSRTKVKGWSRVRWQVGTACYEAYLFAEWDVVKSLVITRVEYAEYQTVKTNARKLSESLQSAGTEVAAAGGAVAASSVAVGKAFPVLAKPAAGLAVAGAVTAATGGLTYGLGKVLDWMSSDTKTIVTIAVKVSESVRYTTENFRITGMSAVKRVPCDETVECLEGRIGDDGEFLAPDIPDGSAWEGPSPGRTWRRRRTDR